MVRRMPPLLGPRVRPVKGSGAANPAPKEALPGKIDRVLVRRVRMVHRADVRVLVRHADVKASVLAVRHARVVRQFGLSLLECFVRGSVVT